MPSLSMNCSLEPHRSLHSHIAQIPEKTYLLCSEEAGLDSSQRHGSIFCPSDYPVEPREPHEKHNLPRQMPMPCKNAVAHFRRHSFRNTLPREVIQRVRGESLSRRDRIPCRRRTPPSLPPSPPPWPPRRHHRRQRRHQRQHHQHHRWGRKRAWKNPQRSAVKVKLLVM